MKIIVEGLVIPSLILAFIYFVLSIYGVRGLLLLNKVTHGLNTKKLFVMNCLLASFLRFLSFTSMAVFNYFEITISLQPGGSSGTDEDQSKLEQFFYKASLVQFDLPDFCFVSAYVLLLIVWAEAILQSRRHWLSSYSFRRIWILSYFFFNILLYSVQVSLYSLLFFPKVDQRLLGDFIYLTLTVISIGVPVLWLLCYLYLLIQFSGFPYLSEEARDRLDYLNGLGSFWTLTRLIWGVLALTSVLNDWFDLTDQSVEFYSIALVCDRIIITVIIIIIIIIDYRCSDSSNKLLFLPTY